jgi:hypothetical protein
MDWLGEMFGVISDSTPVTRTVKDVTLNMPESWKDFMAYSLESNPGIGVIQDVKQAWSSSRSVPLWEWAVPESTERQTRALFPDAMAQASKYGSEPHTIPSTISDTLASALSIPSMVAAGQAGGAAVGAIAEAVRPYWGAIATYLGLNKLSDAMREGTNVDVNVDVEAPEPGPPEVVSPDRSGGDASPLPTTVPDLGVPGVVPLPQSDYSGILSALSAGLRYAARPVVNVEYPELETSRSGMHGGGAPFFVDPDSRRKKKKKKKKDDGDQGYVDEKERFTVIGKRPHRIDKRRGTPGTSGRMRNRLAALPGAPTQDMSKMM